MNGMSAAGWLRTRASAMVSPFLSEIDGAYDRPTDRPEAEREEGKRREGAAAA